MVSNVKKLKINYEQAKKRGVKEGVVEVRRRRRRSKNFHQN